MFNLTEKEFKNLKKKSGHTDKRETKRIQNRDKIFSEYKCALAILRDLQSDRGAAFLGHSLFRLQVHVIEDPGGDETNVQKGCEDALNRVAYFDDQQNRYLSEPPSWGRTLS